MKKHLCLLLTVLLLCSLLPANTYAVTPATGTWGDNITWKLDFYGHLTISGTGDMDDGRPNYMALQGPIRSVEITSGVTGIGEEAFKGLSELTSITIADTVTSIGAQAFYRCGSLTQIDATGYGYHHDNELPYSVTYIGESAFNGCKSLGGLKFPDGLKRILNSAFYGCASLTNVNLSNSLTSIGPSVFYGCKGLTDLQIPNSVKTIGYDAFHGCSGLTSLTIGSGVETIGNTAFEGCSSLTSVAIPNSVKKLEAYTFYGCSSLADVTLSNRLTSIGDYAFCYCSALENVTIPESVTAIGKSAFEGCSSLTNVEIPAGVTQLGDSVFCKCTGLEAIQVSESNPSFTSVDGVLFDKAVTKLLQYPGGKPGAYAIPDGVTTIGPRAFHASAGLTSLTIPASVTGMTYLDSSLAYMGSVFSACPALTAIEVAEGNQNYSSIDGVLFNQGATGLIQYPGGKAGAYVVPESVTWISQGAFYGCTGLTAAEISDRVNSIGWYAFYGCSGLQSVTIPSGVTTIQGGTFGGCEALADVYYTGSYAQWNQITTKTGNDPLKTAEIHYDHANLAVTAQPKDKTVNDGKTAKFTVGANGVGLTWQWQYSADGGATWKPSPLNSAKTASISFKAKTSLSGRLYRCIVTDQYGFQVISNPARLTVEIPVLGITVQPADVTVNSGEKAAFTVKATGTGLTYQWQYSTDGGATWKQSTVKSAAKATISFSPKASFDGRLFRCVITDENGTQVISNTAKLTVKTVLAITTQPKPATVSAGEKATFAVKASGTGLTYQWQYSADNGSTWKNSTASCARSATFTITPKTSFSGRLYRCVITDASGASLTSDSALLTVQ